MKLLDKIMKWFESLGGPPAPPLPKLADEWLVVKRSGIAHKFYTGGSMHSHYRYSACGFETTQDKLRDGVSVKVCPKCRNSKGW